MSDYAFSGKRQRFPSWTWENVRTISYLNYKSCKKQVLHDGVCGKTPLDVLFTATHKSMSTLYNIKKSLFDYTVSLSIFPSFSLSLSPSLPLSLFPSLPLSLSPSVPLSPSLPLSLSPSLPLSPLSPSLSLSLPLSPSLSLSLPLSPSLSLSLPLSLSLFLCH